VEHALIAYPAPPPAPPSAQERYLLEGLGKLPATRLVSRARRVSAERRVSCQLAVAALVLVQYKNLHLCFQAAYP
jgi:hypothetical protein